MEVDVHSPKKYRRVHQDRERGHVVGHGQKTLEMVHASGGQGKPTPTSKAARAREYGQLLGKQ